MNTKNNTRFNRARLMAALRTLGVGGAVIMMLISGAVMPVMADQVDAGHTEQTQDTYSTTSGFDSMVNDGSSANYDTSNDTIVVDGTAGDMTMGYYQSVGGLNADSVTVDVESYSGSIQIWVKDSSGNSITDKVVESTGEITVNPSGTFDSFEISTGTTADDIATVNSFTVSSTESASGEISGSVTDADGNAISSATVDVVDSSGANVASVDTDANGDYSVTSVADGDYDVSVTHADYDDSTTKTVTVSGGSAVTADFSMTETLTGEISGTVTDADGNAVESATVDVVDSTGTNVASLTTDASGMYTASSLADGDYDVTVTHADYVDNTQSVTVSGGSAVTADFSMSVPTTGVEVTATAMVDENDDGTEEEVVVEGATVEVYDTSDNLVDSGTSDANGVYTAEVAAGDYTVVTSFDDETDEQSVTVSDGSVNSISVEFADATDSSSGDNGGTIVDTAEENASILGIGISIFVLLGFGALLYRDM